MISSKQSLSYSNDREMDKSIMSVQIANQKKKKLSKAFGKILLFFKILLTTLASNSRITMIYPYYKKVVSLIADFSIFRSVILKFKSHDWHILKRNISLFKGFGKESGPFAGYL